MRRPSFRVTEIRHVLYQGLGALHRRAGETLERRAQPERLVEELAHHFSQAGEVEKALIYSIATFYPPRTPHRRLSANSCTCW
ncbi:MAG: hypothetical protein L6R45_33940 [Anaerolineae bacterium]|nr:hypothetical protein [Anaerolineae bacterium]